MSTFHINIGFCSVANRPMNSTIGAGDTFIAGILYALNFHGNSRSESWTLERSLGFATELAGRKVIQEGFGGLGEQMAGKL